MVSFQRSCFQHSSHLFDGRLKFKTKFWVKRYCKLFCCVVVHQYAIGNKIANVFFQQMAIRCKLEDMMLLGFVVVSCLYFYRDVTVLQFGDVVRFARNSLTRRKKWFCRNIQIGIHYLTVLDRMRFFEKLYSVTSVLRIEDTCCCESKTYDTYQKKGQYVITPVMVIRMAIMRRRYPTIRRAFDLLVLCSTWLTIAPSVSCFCAPRVREDDRGL